MFQKPSNTHQNDVDYENDLEHEHDTGGQQNVIKQNDSYKSKGEYVLHDMIGLCL